MEVYGFKWHNNILTLLMEDQCHPLKTLGAIYKNKELTHCMNK